MASTTFACPHCHALLSAAPQADAAGRPGARCPACGQPITLPAGDTPAAGWLYAHGKQKLGPFSWQRLRELAADGALLPDDHVLAPGETCWVRAGNVVGLCGRPEAGSQVAAGPAPRHRLGGAALGEGPPGPAGSQPRPTEVGGPR